MILLAEPSFADFRSDAFQQLHPDLACRRALGELTIDSPMDRKAFAKFLRSHNLKMRTDVRYKATSFKKKKALIAVAKRDSNPDTVTARILQRIELSHESNHAAFELDHLNGLFSPLRGELLPIGKHPVSGRKFRVLQNQDYFNEGFSLEEFYTYARDLHSMARYLNILVSRKDADSSRVLLVAIYNTLSLVDDFSVVLEEFVKGWGGELEFYTNGLSKDNDGLWFRYIYKWDEDKSTALVLPASPNVRADFAKSEDVEMLIRSGTRRMDALINFSTELRNQIAKLKTTLKSKDMVRKLLSDTARFETFMSDFAFSSDDSPGGLK